MHRLSVPAVSRFAAGLLLFSAACFSQAEPFTLEGEPVVAFIYASPAKDGGWNEAIDNARQKVADQLDVKVMVAESIPEEASALVNAIDLFVRRGANIIVATTYGYSEGVKQAAEKYPHVAFLSASGIYNSENLESFYARTYEAWYLAGMAAASVSETNKLGMLGGFPVSVVNWDINGFALGVQSSHPQTTVNAIYTNSWWDPVREGQAAQSLIEMGADVIANNLSSSAPFSAAERNGHYSVGFQLDMSGAAPNGHLTSVVFNWDKHLIPTIQKIIDGSWEPNPYGAFPGLAEGVVDITPLHADVPAEALAQIEAAKAEMISGQFSPFTGPLFKQDGTEVLAEGAELDAGDVWGMDYLVKGVIGSTR
ncbi:BMP family ABC transporter substrate-binding protein [Nitrincola sp.]|uniref:BMP family ABC transporter substrate-binding protein n=1 Tax=Nitrincola sp. TaxID=1926584 RepID=UPI003A8E5AC0